MHALGDGWSAHATVQPLWPLDMHRRRDGLRVSLATTTRFCQATRSLSLSLSRVFVLACLFLPPSLQDDSPPPPASSSSSSPVYTLYLMLLVFPWLRGQSEDTPPAYIGHGETHLTGYSLDRTYCREQQSVPIVGSTHRPTGELVGRR